MSSSITACPRCSSRRLVRGELFGDGGTRFKADHVTLSALRLGVTVAPSARACAECGFLWSEVGAHELRTHLGRLATPEVKAWLDEKPDRPLGAR